ncbi:ABC transporter permease [Streptomyces abyssomicinicus]|uniref:ABC transporter permease n=1 Tax=Streptomyces abyssomicinicus TaxID=574929 RepID=UPI0014782BDD|nr:ABC transporter permease [Streptomyces abyssomicinicus]
MTTDSLTPSGGPGGTARPGNGAAPESRIHDIGYRGYDGPRLGRAYARRSLFAQSLRGAFGLGRSARSKIVPVLITCVMTLPAVIAVAVTMMSGAAELPMTYVEYTAGFEMVITLFLAAQAPQAVSLDLRYRTMPLYFSRPIAFSDYVRAKYLAMACAVFMLTALPQVVLYAGALLAKLDFANQTSAFAEGLAGAAVLALLYSGIGLVVAALTPRRGFGVAAVIAVMMLSFAAVSTLQVAADLNDAKGAVSWLGLFSPSTLIYGLQHAFLGDGAPFPGDAGPSTTQGIVYLLVVAVLIAGSYGLLIRRYRKAGL